MFMLCQLLLYLIKYNKLIILGNLVQDETNPLPVDEEEQ